MATYVKTLDDLIEYTDSYDYRGLVYYRQVENLVVPATNAYTIYWSLITPLMSYYLTTDEQRRKYTFKPYNLSVDLYGTPSLGWLIMKKNNCEAPSKFKVRKRIRLIPGDDLQEINVKILSKCSSLLQENWSEYTSDLDFVYPYSDR